MATGTLIGLAVGASVLSTAGVVASGIMAHNAQKSANETNVNLQREMMQYQTSEREATQEYNTPENQRQRFEQAGFNPYMMMSSMDAGNSNFQTGLSPATVQPETGLADMIQNLGQSPSQALNIVQQAQQVQGMEEANQQAHVETLYKEREKLADLRLKAAQAAESMSQMSKNSQEYKNASLQYQQLENDIKLSHLNLKYHESYLQSRNKKERNMAELVYQQERNAFYEAKIKSINANYQQAINEGQLKSLLSAAAAQWSQAAASHELAGLYSQQSQTEFALRALRKAGLHLDNEQKDIIISNLGDQIRTGLEWQRTQIRQGVQDIENPFRYFGAGLGALVGAGLAGAAGRTVVTGFGR